VEKINAKDLGGKQSNHNAVVCAEHKRTSSGHVNISFCFPHRTDDSQPTCYQAFLLLGSQCLIVTRSKLSCCFCRCVETPCKKCKDCIVQMQDFIGAQALETNMTAVANAFAATCKSFPFNRPAGTCDGIKAYIMVKGNVGKRAGALCGLLESCAAGLGSDCSITAGSLTGRLDVCSVEGVQGGKTVPGVQGTEGRCEGDAWG
jgi:hypothetical protein